MSVCLCVCLLLLLHWPTNTTVVSSVFFSSSLVFTRDSIYAIARICYRPSLRLSVRLSVRPSHGWIIQKRLKLGLWNFHHTVSLSL